MSANDYANRFGVKLALKDVRLGCEMGDAWGYSAEFTKLAKSYFEKKLIMKAMVWKIA